VQKEEGGMPGQAAENAQLVRRFVAAYSDGRIEDALELVTEDYRSEDAAALTGGVSQGKEAFAAELRSIRGALPDVREELLDLVPAHDKVAFRIRAAGHHTGDTWMGMPPTGALVTWECIGIWFVRDGRLCGEVYLDDLPAIQACLHSAG
jgi:predicted ester cyclase